MVTAVEKRLDDIRRLLPRGATIGPFYDQGYVVDNMMHTVFKNLLEGGLLVTLILFVFLRNIRASLITASVIPLSLLFAFLAMKEFGVSANLMSLGALDFGLIVDASVVMVENFVRRLEHAGDITPDARLADPIGGPRDGPANRVRRLHHHCGVPADLHARGPRERLRQPLGRLHRDVMTAVASAHQKHDRANAASPLFGELRNIVLKTVGLACT